MKQVARYVREKSTVLAHHPLFTEWLNDPAVDPADKFMFSPMAIDFVMGFRDLNRYFIIYPQPRNAFEEGLNEHAREDSTHSALFVTDWATLGLDERLGWAPRDLFWWQTSAATVEARRADFELTRLVWQYPDPLYRFAIIEAMEMAGNVFFRRTVPVAEKLEARTGQRYPYYGQFHLERETGHLQNADERLFYGQTLTEAQRETARMLVDRVFAIFDLHFRSWLRVARAIHSGTWPFDVAPEARALSAVRAERPYNVSRCFSLSHPAQPAGEWAALSGLRAELFSTLWESPFCSWLRSAPAGEFHKVARSVMLQWTVDAWACSDWFLFDTTYPDPVSPVERGINRLSTLYASEMNRRYVEWESLGLDEITGWRASEALRHYWLDEKVEEMRSAFASLRTLTFEFPKPLHRYWIMKSFVRFGDAMMDSLGVAMKSSGEPAEAFPGMAGCPDRLHPDLPPDPEADEAIARLESTDLSAEDAAVLREILRATSAQEARRLAVSWQVIEEERFAAFERRWAEHAARAPGARRGTEPMIRGMNQ